MRYSFQIGAALSAALLSLAIPAQAREWEPLAVASQAVQVSPVLRDYEARAVQNRYTREEAEAPRNPTLSFSGSYNYLTPTSALQAGPVALLTSVNNNYNLGLSFRQLIYSFGQVETAVQAEALAEKVARWQYLDQQERVAEDALVQFHEAALAHELLIVAEDALKVRESALLEAQQQYQAGVVSRYDVLRSKTLLFQAQQARVEAIRDVKTARHKLFAALDTPESESEQLSRLLAEPSPPPDSVASAVEKGVLIRSDILAARTAAEEAQARVAVAQSGDAPRLEFQSDYSRRNSTVIQPDQQFTVGIALSIPLFDGGFARIRSQRAQAVADQYGAALDTALRQARVEVAAQFEDLQAGWNDIASSKVALESAQEAARVSRLRYKNGLNTYVELLDAEAALSDAQGHLARARRNYEIAWVHWSRQTGVKFTLANGNEEVHR